MNAIQPLAKETVRFLNSGQVITDLSTIVKELVENALDAEATAIEVKLMDYGLSAISVKDNGCGIPEIDRKQMGKRFCTSKLESFENLTTVMSYGFRGEALNSICAISKETQIITKTKDDSVAKLYDLDATGSIKSEKNNVAGNGTVVTAKKPFYNIPVRRQLAQKNAPQTASKIQEILVAYGLVHPNVRFTLLHTQGTVGNKKKPQNWIKPAVADQMEDIKVIFGKSLADQLQYISIDESKDEEEALQNQERDDGAIHMDAVLPIKGSDPSIVCKGDHVYVYINSRPIQTSKSDLKELVSLVKQRYRLGLEVEEDYARKTPFIMLNICLPPNQYDVNIEPSKNAVLLHHKQSVLNLMESLLDRTYSTFITDQALPNQAPISPPISKEPLPSAEAVTTEPSTSDTLQSTIHNTSDMAMATPSHNADLDVTNTSLSTSTSTVPKLFDDTIISSNTNNTNSSITQSTPLEDSDIDSMVLPQHKRPLNLQQSPPSIGTTSLGTNIRSSTTARLQEWQFQGGKREPKTRSKIGDGGSDIEEEPLFRSPKKPRTEGAAFDATDSPLPILGTTHASNLPKHAVSAHANRESDTTLNSFDVLMTSRERLPRRPGTVEHMVIEEPPTQRHLTQFLEKSNQVSSNPYDADKPSKSRTSSVIQPPRPTTPIQNVLQTPLETRRRRQHLTLMDVEHDTFETLNITLTQDVDVAAIRKRYKLHQARMARFYRTPLGEYKSLGSSSQFTCSNDAIASLEQGLELYVSQCHHPSTGTIVCKIAAVDTERVKESLQYQHLIASKDLSNDLSGTEEPCILHLSDQEYQILSTLAHTDNVVTDARLTMNGIIVHLPKQATEAAWAKFSPLIEGYSDIQKILWLIQKGEEQVSSCRPRKVLQILQKEAKETPWDKPLDLFASEQQPGVLMLPW